MARKPTLTHTPVQARPTSPPAAAPLRAASRRILWMMLALLVLLLAAWQLRGSDFRLWWLSRQSEAALQQASVAENADPWTRYAYAKRLFDQHRYDQALEAFRAAEKSLPPNAHDTLTQQTFSHLGFLLIAGGNEKEAAGYLKRAQEMNDDDTRVHAGLGLLFVKREQRLYAENQFKIAVHTDPGFAEGWYYLGKNYNDMRSYSLALDPLLKASRLAPSNPNIWSELGQVYTNLQQFNNAIPALRKACELQPENLAYRTALGSAMANNARTQQEYQEAAALLEDSLRLKPNNALAEFALGTLQEKFDHLPEAREHLRQLVAQTPDVAEGWYKLAQVEQRMGHTKAHEQAAKRFQLLSEYNKTLSVLNTKLGSDPNNATLHLQRARFLWKYSDLVGALAEYRAALSLEPKNQEAIQELQQKQEEYQTLSAKNPQTDYHHLHPPPLDTPIPATQPGKPQGTGNLP